MRPILTAFFAATVMAVAAPGASGQEGEDAWRHATSLVEEEAKYPPDFAHFDYVNPDAPKGGVVRMSDVGTFDSLNFVPPRGSTPLGLGLIYDTLMTSSLDEVSTEYGLIAEAMKYPDDYSSVTFRLREDARWNDGEPVTVEDVIFSFDALKAHNPQQAYYYQHVVGAEATGEREVTFTFDESGNRELPHIVGQLLILPRHYWEGTDARGAARDISRGTLEPPLGSGPYRIKSLVPGRTIVYERVPDYWGKDLPVNIGTNNFDEIRYEYFRDDTVEFEAFKANQVDWRQESTARVWATGYDFPAVRDKRVVLETFEEPYRTAGLMLGFIFNLNRAPFDDIRVRQAFDLVFPYEDINKSLFYSQYVRLDSYFDGIPLAAEGLPEGRELEILEEVRDQVPPEVFTEVFKNPDNSTPALARANMRAALQLLEEAGYNLEGNRLLGPDGRQLTAEFLMNGPLYERIALRYQQELAKIGIRLEIRPVDTSQYENRVRSRDFDIMYSGWAQSMSPGNEQIEYFGSASADREGSRNYGGIRNPAVDALIRKVVTATDRDDLIAATKALDRVLLWNRYLVPGWTMRAARIAHWDRFSHPDPLPEYAIGFPTIWWWDEEKAAKTGGR